MVEGNAHFDKLPLARLSSFRQNKAHNVLKRKVQLPDLTDTCQCVRALLLDQNSTH